MHNRTSDEQIIMEFALPKCLGNKAVINAIARLKECHKLELQDYSVIDKPQPVKPSGELSQWIPAHKKSHHQDRD